MSPHAVSFLLQFAQLDDYFLHIMTSIGLIDGVVIPPYPCLFEIFLPRILSLEALESCERGWRAERFSLPTASEWYTPMYQKYFDFYCSKF